MSTAARTSEPEEPFRKRPAATAKAARSYRPAGFLDYLFMHGLAKIAARQAARAEPLLYPPAEWLQERSRRDGDG